MAGCYKDQHISMSINGREIPNEAHFPSYAEAKAMKEQQRQAMIEYLRSRGVAQPEVYLMELESAKIPEIPGRK